MISKFISKIFYRIARKGLRSYLEVVGLKAGKVLDIGCGYGHYSNLFNKNYDYIGIDNNNRKIESAKKSYPKSDFKAMNAVKLDFPDNEFDLIISISTLHHLTDKQLGKAAGEITRTIKSGGYVLLVDVVLPERFKLFAYPFFWLDKGAQQRMFNQLIGLIEKSGLRILFKQNSRFLNIETCVISAAK